MATYPDTCLCGVTNKDHIVDGWPLPAVFSFSQTKPDDTRMQSVNWVDDEGAITRTLGQTRPSSETRKFPGGAVELSRAGIDRVTVHPLVDGRLSYERDEDAERTEDSENNGRTEDKGDNPYHGNLLLRAGTKKHVIEAVRQKIAFDCLVRLHPQTGED
jgi:hypothetical protein